MRKAENACTVAPRNQNGKHDWIDAGMGDGSKRCAWCGIKKPKRKQS